jgi:hypothetical protein
MFFSVGEAPHHLTPAENQTVPVRTGTSDRRTTVLKKAGIIVAAVATGVLAVSSVAFADTEKGNLSNDCSFEQVGGDLEQGTFGGSGGLLEAVGAVTGIAANATTQANTGNCNNVQLKDLVDQDSNNETKRVTETRIEDSGNTED